jgi:hypothetical protein
MDWGMIAVMAALGLFLVGSRWGYARWERTKPEIVWAPGGKIYGRRADGSFVTWLGRRRVTDPALVAALQEGWDVQQACQPNPHRPPHKGRRGGGAGLSSLLDAVRWFD